VNCDRRPLLRLEAFGQNMESNRECESGTINVCWRGLKASQSANDSCHVRDVRVKAHFVRFLAPQVGRMNEHSLGQLGAGIWHEILLAEIVREAHPLPVVGQMRWSAATEPPFQAGVLQPMTERCTSVPPCWVCLPGQFWIPMSPVDQLAAHGPWGGPTGSQHSPLPLRINMDPAMSLS